MDAQGETYTYLPPPKRVELARKYLRMLSLESYVTYGLYPDGGKLVGLTRQDVLDVVRAMEDLQFCLIAGIKI